MVVDAITREVSVPQGVDWLWSMVSEGPGLASWLCDAGAEVDLRPGGWVSLRWQEFGTFTGVIEAVEPRRRFSFRWMAPTGQQPRAGNSTRVEILLSGDGTTTRLELTEPLGTA